MTTYTIITEDGITVDNWDDKTFLAVNGDDAPEEVLKKLEQFKRIVISFASTHDGRGFSLARQIREAGFKGHLRASGDLVTDQWRHLQQTGFDSVMLTEAQIEKMPHSAWREVQAINLPSYQSRVIASS